MLKNNKGVLAFLGAGISNRPVWNYANKEGLKFFNFSDGDPKEWGKDISSLEHCLGCFDLKDSENVINKLKIFEEVVFIKSPGMPFHHPTVGKICDLVSAKKDWSITGEIEIAYALSKTPIIAVTGTNGKTTTVQMIKFLADNYGVKSFLGGNIGTPYIDGVLDGKRYDLHILELSSFQLEIVSAFKADYSGIINFSFHHGEHHENEQQYLEAKLRIFKESKFAAGFLSADSEYPFQTLSSDEVFSFKNSFSGKSFCFPGDFNWNNFYLASLLFERFLGDLVNHEKFRISQENLLESFRPAPYRLQQVFQGEISQNRLLQIVNDSKSTNFNSVLAALNSKTDKFYEYNSPQTILIMGGKLRGQNDSITKIKEEINKKTSFVYFFGEAAESLKNDFSAGIAKNSLKEVIKDLRELIQNSQSKSFQVIFSPGFPSFDQYKNYIHRGEEFDKLATVLVEELVEE